MIDFVKEVRNITSNAQLTSRYPNWSTTKDCNGDLLYNKLCQDIYAGDVDNGIVTCKWFNGKKRKTIIEVKQGNTVQSYDFSKLDPNTTKDSIVIILESPHKDEYKLDQLWNQPNPAMGSAGRNLEDDIDVLIAAVSKSYPKIKSGKYQIVLMNSIQYQCSLGMIPLDESVRDLVFSQIWKLDEIRKNFVDRLKSYNPQFIFNLCTMGDKVPNLNFLVQALINEHYLGNNAVELFMGYHPSSWIGGAKKLVYDVRKPYKDVIKF